MALNLDLVLVLIPNPAFAVFNLNILLWHPENEERKWKQGWKFSTF